MDAILDRCGPAAWFQGRQVENTPFATVFGLTIDAHPQHDSAPPDMARESVLGTQLVEQDNTRNSSTNVQNLPQRPCLETVEKLFHPTRWMSNSAPNVAAGYKRISTALTRIDIGIWASIQVVISLDVHWRPRWRRWCR